jgi:hypothetical protein
MSISGRHGKDHPDLSALPWNVDALGPLSPMLGGIQAWNGACGKAATAVSGEWLDFLNRRMKEDLALPQQLASCRGLDEAWQVYATFWQKAVQDYQQEFSELARLNSEVMAAGVGMEHLGRRRGSVEHVGRAARD